MSVLRGAVVLFLVFPFAFLMFQFGSVTAPDWNEIWWAAGNSFWQATFSATFSVLFGLWGAMGLLCFSSNLRRRWRSLFELMLLLPNFLPAIFVLLAILNLVEAFPMGRVGIVIVHTAMNWGLAAVLLAGLIESKAGAAAELAWVEGCGRLRFATRVLGPMLAKDLALLWVFIFTVCFGSFAVPLVVGGGRGTTMEVLIYERIRLSTDWSQAVTIALMQSLFLFALAWAATRGRAATQGRPANLRLFQSGSGLVPIIGFSVALAAGYLQGLPAGFEQLSSFLELVGDLGDAFAGSVLVGMATGTLCFLLLLALAILVPSPWFEKFLSGYVAPSQALASFAFLVALPSGGIWPYVKIPLTLALLTLPILWRMGWQGGLDGLKRQREVALTLGASPREFLWDVLIPQLAPRAATLSGLAAVWAVGDFAVSRILAHRDLTLGMMTETLMSGYRLSLASVLSLGLLAVGIFCFFAMKGIGRVLGRRSLS